MRQRGVHRSSQASSPGVVLDLTVNKVVVDHVEFGEQWAELYAVLADAAMSNAAWVTADDLRGLGRWAYKSPASVGKEVLRHVRELARRGAGRVIESPSRGGTKRWRLAANVSKAKLPEPERLQDWIRGRRTIAEPQGLDVARARDLVRASVLFHQGRLEQALDRLRSHAAPGTSSAWDAWHALLLARAQVRLSSEDDEDCRDDIHVAREAWRHTPNAVGKAMDARLTAVLAYADRFEHSETALMSLGRLAASLEHSGDLASLAVVTNVLGLLTQRRGESPAQEASLLQLRAARAHFERAAAIFGLIGDAWCLQAALFNTARVMRWEHAAMGEKPSDAVFAILDLCLEVCDSFRVGDDSIQAEALGAECAWEVGRNDLAETYCARALARADNDSTFEQANLSRLMGLKAIAEARWPEARKQLKTALRLFEDVGNRDAASDVHRALAGLDARR